MKKQVRATLIVVGSVLGILAAHVLWFIYTPTSPGRAIRMDIASGTSAWEISKELAQQHVITDPYTFMTFAFVTKRARNLQAGTYVFEARHYPFEIMDILYKGRSLRYKVTIPEGSDIFDVGDALAATRMFSRAEFIRTAQNPKTAAFFSLEAPSMEGYLFPDTYYLGPNMSSMEIIARMVLRYRQVVTPDLMGPARQRGMSDQQILTLASMIEKEAQSRSEKPVIASVFYNRLRIGMPLQSDPTAIYGLDEFHRDITPSDLRRPSPYNTYLNKGLPPGPICNPGKDAIQAALHPAHTPNLFFVSRGDGHHFFSTTFKQHAAAIERSNVLRKDKEQH